MLKVLRPTCLAASMLFFCAGAVSAAPNMSCARGLKPADVQGVIGSLEAVASAFQDQFEILNVPAGPGRDAEVAGALVGAAMANEMVGTLVSMGPMLALREDFYPSQEREFVVARVAELMTVVVSRVQRVDGAYKRIEARTTQPGIRREAGAARRLLSDVRAILCLP